MLRLAIFFILFLQFCGYSGELLDTLPDSEQQALVMADKVIIYKKVGGKDLKLHIFLPKHLKSKEQRPAILFIHGGGWRGGSPAVHALEALYFSRRGIVTAAISYRLLGKGAESPVDCLSDAKSAIRYLRTHSEKYNIDPNKIISCGGSAGGHLASALATIDGYDCKEDNLKISCIPNAMILLYPAFDLVNGWAAGRVSCKNAGIDPAAFSPALLVNKKTSPALILSGSKDNISKPSSNRSFVERMKKFGRVAQYIEYQGKGHRLFNRNKSDHYFRASIYYMERFLKECGCLGEISSPVPRIEVKVYQ